MEDTYLLKVEGELSPKLGESLKAAEAEIRGYKSELTSATSVVKQLQAAQKQGVDVTDALSAAQTRQTAATTGLKTAQQSLATAVLDCNKAAQAAGVGYKEMVTQAREAEKASMAAASAAKQAGEAQSGSGGRGGQSFLFRALGRGAGMEGLGPGGQMLGRASGVLSGLEGVATGPAIAGFAALAGVVLLAEGAMKSYEDQQKAVGQALQDESKQLVDTGKRWHDLRDFIAEAGDAHKTLGERINALPQGKGGLDKMMAGMTTPDMMTALDRTNSTPEQMQDQADAAGSLRKKNAAQIAELSRLQKAVFAAERQGYTNDAQNTVIAGGKDTLKALNVQPNDIKAGDTQKLQDQIDYLKKQSAEQAQIERNATKIAKATKPIIDGYKDAADQAARLKQVLETFPDTKDKASLSRRKQVAAAAVSAYGQDKTGLPDDPEQLRGLALTARDKATRDAVAGKQAVQAQSQTEEQNRFTYRLSEIQAASQNAKDAGLFDPQAQAPATRNPDGTYSNDQTFRVQPQRQRESDYTQQALGLAKQYGSQDQQRGLESQLRTQQVGEGTKDLSEAMKPAKDAYAELLASGTATSAQLVAANAKIKASIDTWAGANKPLISGLHEVQKAVADAYEATKIQKSADEAKRFGEHELDLRSAISNQLDQAVTKADQRKALEAGIAMVVEAQHQGLIKQGVAQQNLIALNKQMAALDRQRMLDVEKQQNTIKDMTVSAGHTKLEELEKERSRGEVTGSGINYQIKALQEADFQHRLDMVDRELEEQRKADRLTTESFKIASLQKQAIIDQETEKVRDAARQRADALEKGEHRDGVRGSALSVSGLPSFGSGFGRMSADSDLTGGGDNDFLKDDGLAGGAARMRKSFANTQLPTNLQAIAQQNAAAQKQYEKANAAVATVNNTTSNTYNTTINAQAKSDPEIEAIVTRVLTKTYGRYNKLNGPAPSTVASGR